MFPPWPFPDNQAETKHVESFGVPRLDEGSIPSSSTKFQERSSCLYIARTPLYYLRRIADDAGWEFHITVRGLKGQIPGSSKHRNPQLSAYSFNENSRMGSVLRSVIRRCGNCTNPRSTAWSKTEAYCRSETLADTDCKYVCRDMIVKSFG